MSKALRARQEQAKKTSGYWVESAKLDFALALERERKRIDISYADVGRALDTSPAYVSKIFRGDANLTIESMVKLARSMGCELVLGLSAEVKADQSFEWTEALRDHAKVSRKLMRDHFSPDESAYKIGQFTAEYQCCNDVEYLNAA